jgi:hypothetical protein
MPAVLGETGRARRSTTWLGSACHKRAAMQTWIGMGTHIRSWESADPQRLECAAGDAMAAASQADGDVHTVMGHLTQKLAGTGDCEHLRKVARILAPADNSAAEAVGAAREARQAAQRGEVERCLELAANAQRRAIDARTGADRAMEIIR